MGHPAEEDNANNKASHDWVYCIVHKELTSAIVYRLTACIGNE